MCCEGVCILNGICNSELWQGSASNVAACTYQSITKFSPASLIALLLTESMFTPPTHVHVQTPELHRIGYTLIERVLQALAKTSMSEPIRTGHKTDTPSESEYEHKRPSVRFL